MTQTIVIKAEWDPDAKVWFTAYSDLPGLNLEATTIDELREKLPGAIEDLLEDKGLREVPFELVTPGLVKIA
jgi:predicted RNase H-like HicB family nuclease